MPSRNCNETTPTYCPCTPTKLYRQCCQPFHHGALAPSPEHLMRSRYSAFALGLTDYLITTWHPATRPPLDLANNPSWEGLEIVQAETNGEQGMVHFKAYFKADGERGVMEEKSRFIRESGRWFYLEGEVA